jgi:hypothetical protein
MKFGAAADSSTQFRAAAILGRVRSLSKAFQMKYVLSAAVLSIAIALPASAQRLVDPAKLAPEFREAAVKRRAEQIRQRECARKANLAKVNLRDRTAFIIHCLELDGEK